MMTDEELAAIRARVDAATPGPWKVNISLIISESGKEICQPWFRDNVPEFIVHAREDMPALLAEVERLRASLTVAERVIERAGEEEPALAHRLSVLESENAAMREIVEAVANGATTYCDLEDEYCTQDANCMWRSPGQGKPFQMVHTDRCIVTKARAFLATGEGEAKE